MTREPISSPTREHSPRARTFFCVAAGIGSAFSGGHRDSRETSQLPVQLPLLRPIRRDEMKAEEEAAPEAPPEPSAEETLLSEIRDLLKAQG